jgi:hypothetical protein
MEACECIEAGCAWRTCKPSINDGEHKDWWKGFSYLALESLKYAEMFAGTEVLGDQSICSVE